MSVAGVTGTWTKGGLRSLAVAVVCAWLLPWSPACAHDHVIEPFRLQLRWQPQAQFMGYYVAVAKGLYSRQDIEVTLVPGGPGIVPADAIRDGSADAVVEWMSTAYAARAAGLPLTNVAQIFSNSGLILVCHRDHGIYEPADLAGKTVTAWTGGSEISLQAWLASLGMSVGPPGSGADVVLREQGGTLDPFFDGSADCVSAMTYNEYWGLLDRGAVPDDMTIFSYEDQGFAFLSDGLYVDQRRLADPQFRSLVVRFLKASLAGWRYAVDHPNEAAFMVTRLAARLDLDHQQRMASEVARLVGPSATVGLLDLASLDRTLALMQGHGPGGRSFDVGGFWTHDLWNDATGQSPGLITREVRYRLTQVLASPWFYALDLIGTFAFGMSGFLRACERRYDFWGAFILTMLPAVGGGTLRDLLIGGERSPPFIFNDPTYIYIVLGIVILGFPVARYGRLPGTLVRQFDRALLATDTIGLSAFAIIGASVAINAHLAWFWAPICSALTCAGGGVLLDVVTGREPRTFRGEPYEEIGIAGGLLLMVLLDLAGRFDSVTPFIVAAIAISFVFTFALRYLVVLRGWRIPVLGRRNAAPT